MGMHKIAKMPSPEELKEEMPLSEEAKQIKAARDKEIRDVFTGASDKFLVIIGPCSADNETAVMDYLGRLARVQKDLADKLLIIPRIYTNKPRTTGDGYKGMVHSNGPGASFSISILNPRSLSLYSSKSYVKNNIGLSRTA